MKIYSIMDIAFSKYGRVLNFDTEELLKAAEKIAMPAEGSQYVATQPAFDDLPETAHMMREVFGCLPTQNGYCWGHNDSLNALEWHKCSEVNVAVQDFVLLLGDVRDLSPDHIIDSSKIEAFRVCRGQAVEVYATTLHFCPIETRKTGFGCFVGLLAGTNLPLEQPAEDKYLFRQNKWLIAHPDNAGLIKRGGIPGITGENIRLLPEQL